MLSKRFAVATCAILLYLLISFHGPTPLAQQTEEGSSDPATSTEPAAEPVAVATFAGGCFWCMEPPFDKMEGVKSTVSGYTGGRIKNPTYEQVSSGRSGHVEAMQVKFDPNVVTYDQLLTLFWHNIDPTQAGGQFCDKGSQYRSAIFYHSEEQKASALKSRIKVKAELGRRVQTQIAEAEEFYPAEDYHQDYYTKNPTKYKFYRWNCGRDKQLTQIWGDKAGKP